MDPKHVDADVQRGQDEVDGAAAREVVRYACGKARENY